MLNLENYLEMFPPATREKPRFMALAGAVMTQAADLVALVQAEIPAAYDLETASGRQLDTLGELLNVPRPMPSTSDERMRITASCCGPGSQSITGTGQMSLCQGCWLQPSRE